MKRQIGALLACTLMLSMGTTAFAQEPQTVVGTGENGETSITITDITPREEKKDETETRFQTGGCYPIQVQTLQDGDTQLLVKTFLVPQDTDPPDAPRGKADPPGDLLSGFRYSLPGTAR